MSGESVRTVAAGETGVVVIDDIGYVQAAPAPHPGGGAAPGAPVAMIGHASTHTIP